MFFLLFSSNVFCAKLFTDDDLEGYDYSNGQTERAPDTSLHVIQSRGPSQKEDAEYWCNRMTAAKDRLKRAIKGLIDKGITESDIRSSYGRRYIGASAVANAAIEEDKARDEARAARDDVNNIEEEAHRKEIPPGWLYCNY